MLDELKGSLKEKGFTFTYDDALAAYLVKKSYSATYGARNLRRTIQKDVEDALGPPPSSTATTTPYPDCRYGGGG